jgi:hypothetical protein
MTCPRTPRSWCLPRPPAPSVAGGAVVSARSRLTDATRHGRCAFGCARGGVTCMLLYGAPWSPCVAKSVCAWLPTRVSVLAAGGGELSGIAGPWGAGGPPVDAVQCIPILCYARVILRSYAHYVLFCIWQLASCQIAAQACGAWAILDYVADCRPVLFSCCASSMCRQAVAYMKELKSRMTSDYSTKVFHPCHSTTSVVVQNRTEQLISSVRCLFPMLTTRRPWMLSPQRRRVMALRMLR